MAVTQIGRYRIFRRIGVGGMASVYLGRLASEKGFVRPVAIKRLHVESKAAPERLEPLFREARIVSRIRHANVVSVLDVLTEGDESCIVLDYVHGEPLHRLINEARARAEAITLPIIARIGVDVLEGLHAAHEATDEAGTALGIVHRDVSPQNVIVDDTGVARLLDFGIAKLPAPGGTTETGDLKGKLGYMAPEQLDGKHVDRRADVWALGVMLWELVTLRSLFEAPTAPALIRAVLWDEIPPPSGGTPCPPAVEAVIRRCLERDPSARYATARDAAIALEAAVTPAAPRDVAAWLRALAGASMAERDAWLKEVESTPETVERPRRPGWALALAAVALATTSVALWGRGATREPPTPPPNRESALTLPSASAQTTVDASVPAASAPSIVLDSPRPDGLDAAVTFTHKPVRSRLVVTAASASAGSAASSEAPLRLHERK